ncbi:MAG: D-glycero-beta-D-manno-heptose-7-phosphate kinase [Desulfatibacillaceae bacterium]
MSEQTTIAFDFDLCEKSRIIVVGDLMIDEYVWGRVNRISPEAPVQVVSVEEESTTLGGAGNVVNNLVTLGARVGVAGVVGDDRGGERLTRMFRDLGVDADGIVMDPERITTRKTRVIAASQHVVRIDRESTRAVSPEQAKRICRFVMDRIRETDVVLISDYGKGVVSRALCAKLAEICGKAKKLLVTDPKGRDYARYRGVYALTPNRREASLASGVNIEDEASMDRAGKKLLDQTGAERLLLTCGKDGMVVYARDAEPDRIPAKARQVYDVSGAGDTVVAVLGIALSCGADFSTAARLANTAAGIVVGKVGTATVGRAELEEALTGFQDPAAVKQKTLEELAAIVEELRRQGKRIVLTNGCFDLLHAGHVQLFARSRALGDVLVVAVDDDDSVRRIKGAPRPVVMEKDRVRIISALDSVDYVNVFSTDALERLIRTVRPDVLTKGDNYTGDEVQGRAVVEKLGGRVELVPVMEGVSSAGIINTIRDGKKE